MSQYEKDDDHCSDCGELLDDCNCHEDTSVDFDDDDND